MKKKGEIQISFSMIFSIILIAAFVAVAIYAIVMFLGIKKCSETGMFKQDLQDEVNRAWNSAETSFSKEMSLPIVIEKVCFIDKSEEEKGKDLEYYKQGKVYQANMFFVPLKNACEGQKAFNIQHLNISEIIKIDNPYCIDNIKGKVQLNIEKGFYDVFVKIK